jgi:hypothetical protein
MEPAYQITPPKLQQIPILPGSSTILTSATRVQELAVQRIASPAAAASLLLGACGSAWLTTHCAVADTGRKDDPVLFGAEVEEQASMNDNNRRYFSPAEGHDFSRALTIFR